MDSGARPPMKPSVIAVVGTPHRRPTRACETSCATTVTRKPRATITPMSQCSGAPSPGAVAAACWLPMNVTTASTKAHANEMRTSIPNSRARGRPPLILVPPARPRAQARVATADGCRGHSAPHGDRPGAPARDPAHGEREDDHDDTHADRAVHPELLREELDQPLRARVEQVVPTREEDLVEQDERRVEEQESRHPADDRDGDDGIARPRQPSPEPRPGLRPTRRQEHEHQDHRSDRCDGEEAEEHAPHVAHVAPLVVVEDGGPVQGHVEVGRTHHQVQQDRVRDRGQLLRGEAGPCLGLRPLLGERHPDRVEEWQDRQRDDDEGGRDAGDEGSKGAAEGIHQAPMVAGVGPATLVWPGDGEATPPRASEPAPTTSRSSGPPGAPSRAPRPP